MRLRLEARPLDDRPGRFERLDRALVSALAEAGIECSRSRLARAFIEGGVHVDGVPSKPSRPVDRAMEVELEVPELAPLRRAFAEPIALEIAYEDDDVLVVDKPAGMVVHAGPGHDRGTLVNAVLHHLAVESAALPVMPGNGPERPGVVHRLDRDTSGLIVLAKTVAAQRALATQFERHTIDRAYLALVEGIPEWTDRTVDTLHGRDPGGRVRFSAGVEKGKRAVTHLHRLSGAGRELSGASVLRCTLETGRTHQIRVHARHVGHPVLADALYGRRPLDRALAVAVAALTRQALHAARLGFDLPDGSRRVFTSSLPQDLAACVMALGGRAEEIDRAIEP